MKIEGTHQLHAPRERVYEYLTDPQILQRCIPGCERLEKTGENAYSATIRTGVGAIKGLFKGTAKLEDMLPPEHYRIVVEGKGTPGFMKGTGNLDLEAQGETTIIKYTGELQVGGTIASVGQRMIQGTAKMMASQFFLALGAEVNTEVGEPPPHNGLFRMTLRWVSGLLRKVFSPH